MPRRLTLRNVPDALYERLNASAAAHRRSLNGEAIVCLESVLIPGLVAVTERLARARALRRALPPDAFRAQDLDAHKRQGRP